MGEEDNAGNNNYVINNDYPNDMEDENSIVGVLIDDSTVSIIPDGIFNKINVLTLCVYIYLHFNRSLVMNLTVTMTFETLTTWRMLTTRGMTSETTSKMT